MIRIIFILIFVAFISLGVSWIADDPGKVVILWSSYRIDTSVLFLLATTAAFALLCLLCYTAAWLIIRAPQNFMRAHKAKRQTLGLEALTETFAAIAIQDINLAHKKLRQAKNFLPDQPITLMLSAQLARLEGDESSARVYIEQMLGNDATKFMALRSMIESARNSNDTKLAIEHGNKALAINPKDNWLIATMAELHAKSGQLQEASYLLESSLKKRYITKQFYRREIAHMLYENAKSFTESGHVSHAISALKESLRKFPGFVQASTLLADLHVAEDNIKEGLKTIVNAWKVAPHPHLRESLLKFMRTHGGESLPYVKKILRINPEHEESRKLARDIQNHE